MAIGQRRHEAKDYFDTVTLKVPVADNEVIYDSVIVVDSVDKNILYDRARAWVGSTFNNSQKVIQMDDKERGEIICKGVYSIPTVAGTETCYFTLDILLKSDRYRYQLHDLFLRMYSGLQHIDVPLYTYYLNSNDKKHKRRARSSKEILAMVVGQTETTLTSLNKAMTVSNTANKWSF